MDRITHLSSALCDESEISALISRLFCQNAAMEEDTVEVLENIQATSEVS